MALKGTLNDFAISDILQLIAAQSKTGILVVSSSLPKILLGFIRGQIVYAEILPRRFYTLLGNMLLRAGIINHQQLAMALYMQKKGCKRLGKLLIDLNMCDEKTLRLFIKLQISETIFTLLNLSRGEYEFNQVPLEADEYVEPLSVPHILLEGFRQIDEWPLIRKNLPSYKTKFKIVDKERVVAELDMQASLVYALLKKNPDYSVQKLIDTTRLSEFTTCAALVKLLELNFIQLVQQSFTLRPHTLPKAIDQALGWEISGKNFTGDGVKVGEILDNFYQKNFFLPKGLAFLHKKASFVVGGFFLIALLLLATLYLTMKNGFSPVLLQAKHQQTKQPLLKDYFLLTTVNNTTTALEIYKANRGSYPDNLGDLVKANLLKPTELTNLLQNSYVYKDNTLVKVE